MNVCILKNIITTNIKKLFIKRLLKKISATISCMQKIMDYEE